MNSTPYAMRGALNDVIMGANGSCGSYLCTGGLGYDGPTGLGTPSGVAALVSNGRGNGTLSAPAAPAPNFAISASAVGALRPGTAVKSTVTVTPINGFSGTVKLSAPMTRTARAGGLTRRFEASSLLINGGARRTMLVLNAKTGGKYTVSVTARQGALVRRVTLRVVVNDFSLSTSHASAAVARGEQVRFTVKVAPAGSFHHTVKLSVSGLPARDTVMYRRNSARSGSQTITITITTSALDPRKTLSVRIKGVSGALNHAITVVLTVQ
jgi:hypothetical protein